MLLISQYFSRLEEWLWCVERRGLPFWKSSLLAVARVFFISWKRCREDQIFLRASALTLFSLLAVVPVLATLFGIAKGFGLAELVETEIREAFATQEQVMTLLVSFSKNSLEHAKGGVIAGIGVLILVWAVVRMIGNVEASFNSIWRIRRHRSFLRKFTDYLFLVVLLPLLLVFSSSATVVLTSGMSEVFSSIGVSEEIIGFSLFLAKFLPALLLGLGFGFLYAFLPNCKVSLGAALLGGVTTAVLFLLSQRLYLEFQFALASYGAIYGSFAALPLFLIWLQLAWILVLFGAQLTRAIELRDEFEFEPLSRDLSLDALFETSALIGHSLKRSLLEGRGGQTVGQLADELALPRGIVREACDQMQRAQIITRDEDERLVPIIPTEKLEDSYIIGLLRSAGRSLPQSQNLPSQSLSGEIA